MKKRAKLWTWLISLTLVLAVLAAGAKTWAESQYQPLDAAQAALASTATVTVTRSSDGIAFIPAAPKAGFIFYPGGLVPTEAYAPLLHTLAEEGILCVALDMPLRLAVLDMHAADGVAEQHPDITRWSIGGHSLGGAMAASHAAKHAADYAALVLLAAYSTEDVPDGMVVASLYGDADGVMNHEKYAEYRANLPENTVEVVIPGGNHAQFGDYGPQKGDGQATISAQEQITQTVTALLPLLLGE